MLGFLVTVVLVGLSAAQTQGPTTIGAALKISYDRVDRNGDGKLIMSEFRDAIALGDTDHNGKVILREYIGTSTATDRVLAEKIFNHLDYDNDGNIDEDDVKIAFAELDVNRDGGVSFPEYLSQGTVLLGLLLNSGSTTVAPSTQVV